MKFTRTEYLNLMTFQKIDRPMFVELFGPLLGLEEEWANQEASQDEINLVAFDWDYVNFIDCGGNCGINHGFQRQLLEDTPEYSIERDELGRRVKLMKSVATIALPEDNPVTDYQSWLKIKPLYQFSEDRIDWNAVARAKQAQADGSLVVAHIPGAFDTPRELMGDAAACEAYYEQPELMTDILETITETSYRVLDQISTFLTIDQLSVHEDMAGKSGPLVGPRQIKRHFQPYFSQIWKLLSTRGTRIFDMDSDGNMLPIIDDLLECGLNSMHPMEPAAGMDIVALRKKYGTRLAVRGGLDKHVLRGSKLDIQHELEYKMQPIMNHTGIAFGLDHRITNQTPIDNYRYYVNLGRELLSLPPLDTHHQGWQRMAF